MTISSDEYRQLKTMLHDVKMELMNIRSHLDRQDEAIQRLHEMTWENTAPQELKDAIERALLVEEAEMPEDIAKLLNPDQK